MIVKINFSEKQIRKLYIFRIMPELKRCKSCTCSFNLRYRKYDFPAFIWFSCFYTQSKVKLKLANVCLTKSYSNPLNFLSLASQDNLQSSTLNRNLYYFLCTSKCIIYNLISNMQFCKHIFWYYRNLQI